MRCNINPIEYEKYMRLALVQAESAFDKGEFPVGCVIVQNGKVISKGARIGTVGEQGFFSEVDHAEIRAIKNLENIKIKLQPEKAVLFCTMEPCLMCFAAILLSGIKTIVYGYEDPMGGGTNCNLESMAPLYKNSNINIVPGVLRQKSLDLFYDFFNKETNLYWKESLLERYILKQKI
jgi:tRNA(adenine34) deaminase